MNDSFTKPPDPTSGVPDLGIVCERLHFVFNNNDYILSLTTLCKNFLYNLMLNEPLQGWLVTDPIGGAEPTGAARLSEPC